MLSVVQDTNYQAVVISVCFRARNTKCGTGYSSKCVSVLMQV